MKRIIALLLAIVLCLGLTVTSFATKFPATSDESKELFKFSSNLTDDKDESKEDIFFVDGAVTLYDIDWETEDYTVATTYDKFNVIRDDTVMTLKNKGTEKDFYLWVSLDRYTKDDSGKYVCEEPTGYSLRKGGFYPGYYGEEAESAVVELYAGESVSFKATDMMPNGGYAIVTVYQYFPAKDMHWRFSYLFGIDNARVDKILADKAAAEKAEAEKPAAPEAPAIENPFTDVAADAYYLNSVLWAVDNGITYGTSDTTFSPEELCTNAHILTFLWRSQGYPIVDSELEHPHPNVKFQDYYYEATKWAFFKNMTGAAGTEFAADEPCTRASTVVFMWKAAGCPEPASKAQFTDVAADADYAKAVAWAVENGVTNGTSDTTFSPDETCTRGQIVTFLYRYATATAGK